MCNGFFFCFSSKRSFHQIANECIFFNFHKRSICRSQSLKKFDDKSKKETTTIFLIRKGFREKMKWIEGRNLLFLFYCQLVHNDLLIICTNGIFFMFCFFIFAGWKLYYYYRYSWLTRANFRCFLAWLPQMYFSSRFLNIMMFYKLTRSGYFFCFTILPSYIFEIHPVHVFMVPDSQV